MTAVSNLSNNNQRLKTAVLALVGLALVGSAWAALAMAAGCGSCGGEGSHGTALAILGILWYGGILAAACLWGPTSLLVSRAVLVAGGVHGVLLLFLMARGIACAPCILTGVAAVGAAGILLALKPEILPNAIFLLPISGFAATSWLVAVGAMSLGPAPTVSLPPGIVVSGRETIGGSEGFGREKPRVSMVVLFRRDCPYCRELDEKVLPRIRKYFGDKPSGVSLEEGIRRMASWAQRVGPRKSKAFRRIEVQHNMPPSWLITIENQRTKQPCLSV